MPTLWSRTFARPGTANEKRFLKLTSQTLVTYLCKARKYQRKTVFEMDIANDCAEYTTHLRYPPDCKIPQSAEMPKPWDGLRPGSKGTEMPKPRDGLPASNAPLFAACEALHVRKLATRIPCRRIREAQRPINVPRTEVQTNAVP